MRLTAIGIAALALALGPALALEGPGRALFPSSTNLQVSNDEVITGAAGRQVQRAFIPPYSGEVRAQWEVRSGDGSEVTSGAEVENLDACSQQTTGAGFQLLACRIRVAAGMPIIVTARPEDLTNAVSLRNVRLFYAVRDSEGETIPYAYKAGICANKNWCERRTDTCGPTTGYGKCFQRRFGGNPICAEILFQVPTCDECQAPNCTNCICIAVTGADKCNNGANGYPYVCVRRIL